MISIKQCHKYMFMYGITTIVLVLEHYEKNQMFEDCQIIIDAIREQEKRLDCVLFTRITEDSIKECIDVYKKYNLTGKHLIENSKYYADLIIDEINQNIEHI